MLGRKLNLTRHATGKRLDYCPSKDYVCAACGTPWHFSHLERQGYLPSFDPCDVDASATWNCPRCEQLCCCQVECADESETHKCCHLRRKQLKERIARVEKVQTGRKPAQFINDLKRPRGFAPSSQPEATYRGVVLPVDAPCHFVASSGLRSRPAPRCSTVCMETVMPMSLEALLHSSCVKRPRLDSQHDCGDCGSDGACTETVSPVCAPVSTRTLKREVEVVSGTSSLPLVAEEEDLYDWARLDSEFQVDSISPLLSAAFALRAAMPPPLSLGASAASAGVQAAVVEDLADVELDDEYLLHDLLDDTPRVDGAASSDGIFDDLPEIPRRSSQRSVSSSSGGSSGIRLREVVEPVLPVTVMATPAAVPVKTSVTLGKCTCGCWERVCDSSMQSALLLQQPTEVCQWNVCCPSGNGVFGALAFESPFTVDDIMVAVCGAEFGGMPRHWSLRQMCCDGSVGATLPRNAVPPQINQTLFIHVDDE